MNAAQLSAWAQQNRKPLLIGGAALAGGLGLVKARSKKAAAGAGKPNLTGQSAGSYTAGTAGASGATLAGTIPYDSSSADIVSAIGDLARWQQVQAEQKTPTPVTKAPIASTIFAPKGTGNYVSLPNGVGAEVEEDGSLFGITYQQWQDLQAKAGTQLSTSKLGTNLDYYSTERNAWTAAQAAQAAAATAAATS